MLLGGVFFLIYLYDDYNIIRYEFNTNKRGYKQWKEPYIL